MITLNVSRAGEGYTHKNWFYKNIYVNFSMIYLVIDGAAFYNDENGTVPLKKNHLYIFPVRKKFTLYDDPSDQLFHTYIHACTFPEVTSLVEINLCGNSFLSDAAALLRKYISCSDKRLIADIINLILARIFAEVPPDNETENIAARIKKFIDDNAGNKLNLKDISTRFAYSKAHINRVFKKEYGAAPMEYYNGRRLELSVKYLAEGKRCKDISNLLHFSTPAAFCNAFKLKYGLPPGEYAETVV